MVYTLPESMEAVVVEEKGGTLMFRRCTVPKPGAGEVLIRMVASPINPSDLAILSGFYPHQRPFPMIARLEGSGTVISAGLGILPRWLLGKRVACAARLTSGGTWAEYMVTSANMCIPLQSNITLEQGAMTCVNPLTAIAIIEIAKHGHHKVIVNKSAAGALGRMIIRLGQSNGITLINIVRRKEQVDILHNLGAKYVLDSSQSDFFSQLQTLAQQLKATLFLDAVTGKLTIQLLQAAPPGSTLIVYGRLAIEDCIIDPKQLVFENKQIIGFYLPDWLSKMNLLQMLLLMKKVQRLLGTQLSSTVQHRFPLHSIQEAMEVYLVNMSAGKVLLSISEGS